VRGDVYRLPARKEAKGHEQRGARFGVVVQSDLLNISTVLISPTSASARATYYRPVIEISGTETRVIPEQTAVVDAERLGKFVGRLSVRELAAVDQALHDVFGLMF